MHAFRGVTAQYNFNIYFNTIIDDHLQVSIYYKLSVNALKVERKFAGNAYNGLKEHYDILSFTSL
jgi:hypothetical protein